MRLSDLEQSGGLIPSEPVEREVTWKKPDGESVTMTALVRQLPFDAFEKYGDSKMGNMEKSYRFLGDAIVMEDEQGGHSPLGYDNARRLNMALMVVLLEAAQEVNNLGEGKP
jgi:hypothetical protein